MTPTVPETPTPVQLLDNDRIAEILDCAAQLIETDGLARGEWWYRSGILLRWTPGTSCCAIGAVGVASGFRSVRDLDTHVVGEHSYSVADGRQLAEPPHPALAALMRYMGATDPLQVMAWSDNSADRDVVETLRACAALVRIDEIRRGLHLGKQK